MTNGQTSAIVALLILFSVLNAAQVAMIIKMTQPQANQTEPAPPASTQPHQQQVGMAIMWRTPQASGMSPREVLASTVARMQYEQTTLLGSDRNAQALVKAMEALAILEGRSTETADGFPIIE
jgi:cytochrome c oxidase assembly factor CtaG